jgi:hypothetical protein
MQSPVIKKEGMALLVVKQEGNLHLRYYIKCSLEGCIFHCIPQHGNSLIPAFVRS